jgi:NAD(P)-dependent dehydrogenase (short-subunit alcohol dehydrogenase family)
VGRERARADTALDRLKLPGHDVAFEACDTAVRVELRHLLERVLASHGRVDILINAAGLNSATPFLDISDEEMERVVAVNQLAVMRSCQAFGRYFIERSRLSGVGASIIKSAALQGSLPSLGCSRTRWPRPPCTT